MCCFGDFSEVRVSFLFQEALLSNIALARTIRSPHISHIKWSVICWKGEAKMGTPHKLTCWSSHHRTYCMLDDSITDVCEKIIHMSSLLFTVISRNLLPYSRSSQYNIVLQENYVSLYLPQNLKGTWLQDPCLTQILCPLRFMKQSIFAKTPTYHPS